jgi:hypothetical protein
VHEETVRFRGAELRVSFEYQAREEAGRESPPSPEFVEITGVKTNEDIADLIGSDSIEEIAKLVLLRREER